MKKLFFLLWLFPVLISAQISSNMTMLSNVDLPDLPTRFGNEYSDCWGFRHANGTEIAILGGIKQIFFINVTSPANPTIIYTHDVEDLPNGNENASLWRDFKTYGNYAYAASDEGTAGLLIFDLSGLPSTVTMVHQTNAFWNRTHNIYIDEQNGRLYGAGSNTVSNGLVILDLVADPENPTLLANLPLNGVGGGYVHDVHVRNHIAYCSHGSLSKLQMYDLSDLPNITVVGTIDEYPEPGYNHSSWVNAEGNFLVMADETHGSDLKLVDITDPENISSNDITTFFSELEGPAAPGSSIAHNPFILGDFAYIAYYHDGVQVFDISDPQDIQLLAYYDTYPDNEGYQGYSGCWGVYPYLPSGIILGSDGNYGLYVLQINSFPLDINFLAFDASRQTEGVRLDWTVADAAYGDTFEIMRSADHGISFEKIGHMKLKDGDWNYTYLDQAVYANLSYMYRIDFIEHDGRRIPSPLRVIQTSERKGILNIVNPVRDQLVLSALEPIADLELNLFDIDGKLIWSTNLEQSSPRMEFQIEKMIPGSYLLTTQWLGGTMNRLIQKME